MEPRYRELIENNGGIFEYHAGHMQKGSKKLENLVGRADLVLCLIGCNSHMACSVVKDLAKKHGKQVRMLSNSSLSSVSRAVREAGTAAG
jgi:hypothetical protein